MGFCKWWKSSYCFCWNWWLCHEGKCLPRLELKKKDAPWNQEFVLLTLIFVCAACSVRMPIIHRSLMLRSTLRSIDQSSSIFMAIPNYAGNAFFSCKKSRLVPKSHGYIEEGGRQRHLMALRFSETRRIAVSPYLRTRPVCKAQWKRRELLIKIKQKSLRKNYEKHCKDHYAHITKKKMVVIL